jgi:hypothetical protein
MGACTFGVRRKGETAREAFSAAVSDAQHENGHGGYSGTIAEKSTFVMIDAGTPPEGEDPVRWRVRQAGDLLDRGDPRVDDKWGPAGCVKLGDGDFYFFGWASE